jgi:hypothetical protein
MCSCPHPENHARGDRRPSFSASVDTGQASPYICYGCHATGTLEGLAIQNGHPDLVPDWKPKKLGERPWLYVPSTNAGKFRHLYRKKKKPPLFRDVHLEPFKGVLSGYLKARGITLDTAREWELGLDRRNRRAIFPVRNMEGTLALLVGRDVTGRSRVKYSNYVFDKTYQAMVPFIDHQRESEFVSPAKSHFLYGEHKAWDVAHSSSDRRSTDLIVVEGAIDVLMVWQWGWNVVGVLGSYPSEVQIEKLVSLTPRGQRLVVMADGDEPGRKLTTAIGERIGSRVPVFDAQLDEGMDPGGATEQEIDEALSGACMIHLTSNQ